MCFFSKSENGCYVYLKPLCILRTRSTQAIKNTRILFLSFQTWLVEKLIFTSTDCVIARPVVKSRAELYTLTFTLALHSHLHIYHLASFCMYKNRRSKNSSAVTHFHTSFFSFNMLQCPPLRKLEAPSCLYTFILFSPLHIHNTVFIWSRAAKST